MINQNLENLENPDSIDEISGEVRKNEQGQDVDQTPYDNAVKQGKSL